MDDDDETTEIQTLAPCRLQAIDVVILIFDAIQTFFGELTNMVCQHANWRAERAQVANEMRANIERIVSE